VGQGFSLEVSADRTVVRVGDPIELTLQLRGDGLLESAGIPPLDVPGWLPADDFGTPQGELAGRLENGTKTFRAQVRVKRPGVTEIPALSYAFFNPRSRAYESVQSRPIALSVSDAQRVGAAEVVRPGAQPVPPPAAAAAQASPPPTSSLLDADLAIERAPERLLSAPAGARPGVLAMLYGGGLAALLLGGWVRRRRARDPVWIERRGRLHAELRGARRAAKGSDVGSVRALASSLRAMIALDPRARSEQTDQLLAECDALVFAPEGASPGADAMRSVLARGCALAEQIGARASREGSAHG
jgi:hypothetical protein